MKDSFLVKIILRYTLYTLERQDLQNTYVDITTE